MHFRLIIILFFLCNYSKGQAYRDTAALNEWGDLSYKGEVAHYKNKAARAKSYWKKAFTLAEKYLGKETVEYSTSCNNLAKSYEIAHKYKDAEKLFLEAKTIREKILGKSHEYYALSCNNLGYLYLEMKDYELAEPLFLEAREVYDKVAGKGSEGYRNVCDNLAGLFTVKGLSEKAALFAGEAKASKDWMYESNGGVYYLSNGAYDVARTTLVKALNLALVNFGPEDISYAITCRNLGTTYLHTENLSEAEKLLNTSKAIHEKKGLHDENYAAACHNLASVYELIGNHLKAEELFISAKHVRELEKGMSYAITCASLGGLYVMLGKYSQAEPLLIEQVRTTKQNLGERNYTYGSALFQLASLYLAEKKLDKAEALLVKTKLLYQTYLSKEHYGYASICYGLGTLYREKKEYDRAESYYLEARQLFLHLFGRNHTAYTGCSLDLAITYEAWGNYSKANSLFAEAIDGKLKFLNRNFLFLSEKEQKSFYDASYQFFSSFERFAAAQYLNNPGVIGDLYNLRLSTKGLLFRTSEKIRKNILSSSDKELKELFNSLRSKRNYLAQVYQMLSEEKVRKEIDEKKLEEEGNVLEKEVSRRSRFFTAETNYRRITWQDVKTNLKSGEVAIEMIRTERRSESGYKPMYLALIVKPDSLNTPDIVRLENGEDLEGRYLRYYQNILKMEDTGMSYLNFWKPIADKIKGVKKVYFSAEGVYTQINLTTLFNPETKRYLLDEVDIKLVSSTKDLVLRQPKRTSEIKNAVLFGFPNYNRINTAPLVVTTMLNSTTVDLTEIKQDSSKRFFNGQDITELPGTKTEVEKIFKLLSDKKIKAKEYLYNEATESSIKALRNPHVLHIATHGFFMSDSEMRDNNLGMETKKLIENPLLRSGLLFAGVKKSFTQARDRETEDGILTAYEAMNLRLDSTDLVILSACQTGLGVKTTGEGIYGLQRAFQSAGARTIVMSLWKVSDQATQELMNNFYENWLVTGNLHEAFIVAQQALKIKYKVPYYWGAFVMVGD